MKASKSLSSYLTCNLVPRRDAGAGQYDVDAPQPQTATCCTALHRAGFGAAPTTHPRYAPLRTPASAAMLVEEEEEEEDQQQLQITPSSAGKKKATAAATKTMIKKMVRKCKSSVADVDMSQMMATSETEKATPRLRRSGAVRRDWSFEDLRNAA